MSEVDHGVDAEEERWIQAMQWHEALRQRDVRATSDPVVQEWREWLADPKNRRTFADLTGFISDGPRLRHIARKAATRRKRSTGLFAAAAAATVLGMLVVSFELPVLWRTEGRTQSPRVFATAVAEVRTFPLDDGSSVTLGAHSTIAVQFGPAYRSVSLDAGEALFRVARDPGRPFVVSAGGRKITAVGTAFVVQREADRVVVTVTDGAVQIASSQSWHDSYLLLPRVPAQLPRTATRVTRGEQLSYGPTGGTTPVRHVDTDAATSWKQGLLEFDHASLAHVVDVINRYSYRRITLDPAVRSYVFTGVVLEGEIDDWLCGLEDIFPVEVVTRGETVLIQPRDSDANRSRSYCVSH